MATTKKPRRAASRRRNLPPRSTQGAAPPSPAEPQAPRDALRAAIDALSTEQLIEKTAQAYATLAELRQSMAALGVTPAPALALPPEAQLEREMVEETRDPAIAMMIASPYNGRFGSDMKALARAQAMSDYGLALRLVEAEVNQSREYMEGMMAVLQQRIAEDLAGPTEPPPEGAVRRRVGDLGE